MEALSDMSGRRMPTLPLRLDVPANPRYAKHIRERIAGFAATHGLADDEFRDFITAIGEAIANAIEHSKSTQPISVTLGISHDELVATIVDCGIGIPDAEAMSRAAALPADLAERGRGMAIMRSCCDRFSIRSIVGQGTVVTMSRFIRTRRSG
jgi:anti-sigma regulatory factor (Ser/Thr protein kinase)